MPFSTSPFFEVQGLASCPVKAKHTCAEPEAWHTLFNLDRESDARYALAHVMDSTAAMYDVYSDFRMCPPIAKRNEKFRAHVGYPWERDKPTRRRRAPETEVTPTKATAKVKKGKKRKKDKVK